MVADFIKARNVLRRRLEAIFEPSAFGELYPETVKAPSVHLGFPVNEPPYYVAVDEIVDTASTSGSSSMAHDTVTYTLHVWLFAQHTRLEEASNALMCYMDAVIGSIMADPRLSGAADNSFARVESAGTSADSSKRYIAAAVIAVECSVWAACPQALAAAVVQANQDYEEEADEGYCG